MGFLKDKLNKIGSQNKQLLVDSSLAFIIRSLGAVASFFMNLVIARQLGVTEAGNFFLGIVLVTVSGILFALGGNNQLVRYLGIYSDEDNWAYVSNVFWQIIKRVLLFAIPATILLISCCHFISQNIFHKNDISPTLFWMFLTIPVYTFTTLLAYAFQGIKKVLLSISLQGIFIQSALSLLVLIIKPSTAKNVGELYFFISVAIMLVGIFYWIKFVHKRIDTSAGKEPLPNTFWKSTRELWYLSILQASIQWGGQFMVGIFCDSKSVALLAVAQRTSMLISFILVAVNLVSAPRFASLYKQKKMDELKRYAINSTRIMVIFALPITLTMILFPTMIMNLFGKGFSGGANLLRILTLGQFMNIVTGSVGYLLMMSGHEKNLKNITLVCGIFSVILNLLLINAFGTLGAAIGISISVAVQNLAAVFTVKKRLGFNTMAIWKDRIKLNLK